jgi:hypothetical protein
MKRIVFLATLALMSVAAMPAGAIPRTFVSSTGAGAACTRAAPCATFQAAHDATDPNGEINCIDSGDYGGLTITKSITVDCAGSLGGISASTVAVAVNAAGGVVRLRNLTLTQQGSGLGAGIIFNSGGTAKLFVENCAVTDFGTDGIQVASNGGATSRLFVSDSMISRNDTGIRLSADATSTIRATLDGVRSENNPSFGLVVDGGRASGLGSSLVVLQVRNSVVTGSGSGLFGATFTQGAAVMGITADRTSFTFNGTAIDNRAAFLVLGRSTVMSNDLGFAGNNFRTFSYQNNHLTGNVTEGQQPMATSLR